MADRTSIEWTDASWTPIRAEAVIPTNDGGGKFVTGWHCEHVSDGCKFCYAERINLRLGTTFEFKPGHLKHKTKFGDPRGDVSMFLDEKMLSQPLRWKRPRMVFVCSMTDLFADFVDNETIDRLFSIMARSPQHTFQVLTKRASRMREYMARFKPDGQGWLTPGGEDGYQSRIPLDAKRWPLPNVWLGVSAENQACADERIPELLQTPAAVRFLSAEPLLGPIDLTAIRPAQASQLMGFANIDALLGAHYVHGHKPPHPDDHPGQVRLDWVIVGGESGPSARPMHPDWARWIRDDCAAAGVSFFFKQWGEWAPGENADFAMTRSERVARLMSDTEAPAHWSFGTVTPRESESTHRDYEPDLYRIGKKRAGRKLDGVEHSGFPS